MVTSLKPSGWLATGAALDRRVAVFKPAPLEEGFAREIGEPEPVVDRRPAAILPAGGAEGPAAGARQPGDRVIIVLRWEHALADVSTSWTVKNVRSGRAYNIMQVDDTERHDRWIYLLCEYGKEGANA